MSPQKSPFEILGISPSAEPVVIAAAYKALARKYHPDMNPGVPPAELNRRMAELNWAKEELERNLEGWRKQAMTQTAEKASKVGPRPDDKQSPAMGEALVVAPQIINLPGRRGATATFEAHAAGLPGSAIRARFKSICIDVQRLAPVSDAARFGITVTEDFTSDLLDNSIETIEVVAPECASNKVFVSIVPVTRQILQQDYGKRVAPPRHVSAQARIPFGKHRGRPFQEIALDDPGYLWWMLREGAGSRIERECARLALDMVSGKTHLGERKRPTRRPLGPLKTKPSSEALSVHFRYALPDPHRPGGLLEGLKALFRPRRRNP